MYNYGELFLMEILSNDSFTHAFAQIENVIGNLETNPNTVHDFNENL